MFADRAEAGTLLGRHLTVSSVRADLVVGLARGGVAVAAALADVLLIPFASLVVKKIGSPGNPELAIGARVPTGQSLNVRDTSVILTDDGAATGATMEAAIRWMRGQNVKKITVALPVAPSEVIPMLQKIAEDVIVLEIPDNFRAVGQFYRDFTQVSDKDVVQLLHENNRRSW